jgi:pilus assembly protein TadC
MYRPVPPFDWQKETYDSTKFRKITRGPRKGQLVRKSKAERRRDLAAWELSQRTIQEAKSLKAYEEEKSKAQLELGVKSTDSHVSFVVLWMLLLFILISLASYGLFYAVVKGFEALHLGFLILPLIFIDFLAWRSIRRPRRNQKYFPLVWWFVG